MTKKIIIKLSGLIAIVVFIVVSLSFITIERKHMVCSGVSVSFFEPYEFITATSVEKTVKRKFPKLKGALLDTLDTNIIEQEVEKNPWVKHAEVFKGFGRFDSISNAGGIKIKIEQETPVFRYVDGEAGFYVNENGKHMPISSTHTANVIVVTGALSDSAMVADLLYFIDFIDEDDFWKAQVQQIHVRQSRELVLVPRVGDHYIELGKIENLEKKFRNLKAVYKDGFSVKGWDKYKTISLKFENQVVCTLK